jgi:DNA-binding ferritin-like protein
MRAHPRHKGAKRSGPHAAMERAAEYDAVTEDLLRQTVQSLEEHAWMFSAQREH